MLFLHHCRSVEILSEVGVGRGWGRLHGGGGIYAGPGRRGRTLIDEMEGKNISE